MPKRKNTSEQAPFKSVIQVALLPEMVDQVVHLVATPADVLAQMSKLPEYGLAVGINPNPTGGYSCSIRSLDAGSGNGGLMFFGNGPTPLEAIAVALVKLDFLERQTDWSVGTGSASGNGYR